MGELYEPYPKLPKNIRQIGERDDIVRVYAEDYVNTYLKRLFPAAGQDLRAGLLLGNIEEHGGVPYVFIDGAMEMEGVTEEGEKVNFSEEAWKRAYQTIEEMFPKRTVQGWFLCGAPGSQLSPLNYWKQHGQYFNGKHKLMYLNSGLEGEEALYITSSDGFYRLRGYCIYYERNQMMKDYMVMRKENRRVEDGGSDPVIRNFRRKMEQKKEHADDQSRTIQFLKGMCGCLAVLTLAGGVAAFNSAEKMKDMEAVMASVLPEAESLWDSGKSRLLNQAEGSAQKGQTRASTERNKEKQEKEPSGNAKTSSGLIIEEAAGDVFPLATAQEDEETQTGGLAQAGEAQAGTVQAGEAQTGATQAGDFAQTPPQAEDTPQNQPASKQGTAARTEAASQTQTKAPAEGASQTQTKTTAEAASQTQTKTTAEAASQNPTKAPAEDASQSQENPQTEGTSPSSENIDDGTEQKKDADGQAEAANSTQAKPVRQKEPKPGQGVYVVQQGETLYGICFKLYQNINRVDEICEINGITDVNMLEAGFRLIVP